MFNVKLTLCEKGLYSKFFWSVFSRIRTEYGEILSISPYLVRMRKNTNQKTSEYEHISCSVSFQCRGGQAWIYQFNSNLFDKYQGSKIVKSCDLYEMVKQRLINHFHLIHVFIRHFSFISGTLSCCKQSFTSLSQCLNSVEDKISVLNFKNYY